MATIWSVGGKRELEGGPEFRECFCSKCRIEKKEVVGMGRLRMDSQWCLRERVDIIG